MSHEIHQHVTDRILKALAAGQVPWQRPWLGHKNDGPPTNVLTGLSFKGINHLLLQMAGFRSKWWGEQRLWNALLGFEVKARQEGTQVYFGEPGNLRAETVFNAEQVEGPGVERYLVTETTGKRWADFEAADKVIAATGADIRHIPRNGARYFYPSLDYIELPLKDQFLNGSGKLPAYYATLHHELSHWSEPRLRWLPDRQLTAKERYAINEMRADLGSAFLSEEVGIPPYHNSTGHEMFVARWMKLMQADSTLVFRVASAASEAAKFILSFSEKQRQTA